MAGHQLGPAGIDRIGLQTIGNVQIGISEPAVGHPSSYTIDRGGRNDVVIWVAGDALNEIAVGADTRGISGRSWITRENGTITFCQREARRGVSRKLFVELRKNVGHD